MTSHRDRLETCVSGALPDRPPVALWRHFPVDDQDAARLAAATIAYQKTFEFDLIKVTPASSYCLRDWGAQDTWQGAVEGTRRYSDNRVVQSPEDWQALEVLDPYTGSLGRQLECLKLLQEEFQGHVPILQTIFSPLSQAKNLAGPDRMLHHLRREPAALRSGLAVIAKTTSRFIQASQEAGIDGVFFAVQHAQDALLSEAEYLDFGSAFDLQALSTAGDLWANMLHIHGKQVMFDIFLDYPMAILNWHDQETPPSLAGGLKKFSGAVCGGLSREDDLVLGTPDRIAKSAQAAIRNTGGGRLILGTGCVTPTNAPYGNIMAARNSVERG